MVPKFFVATDEKYPVFTILEEKPLGGETDFIELTQTEFVEIERVTREYLAWQDLIRRGVRFVQQ